MSAITTHVLDTARGRPAAGLAIRLEQRRDGGDGSPDDQGAWTLLGQGETDADGRLASLLPEGQRPAPGSYRLVFDTGAWFARQDVQGFYPWVELVFELREPSQHHHVPLLLSPWGYSTYRGS